MKKLKHSLISTAGAIAFSVLASGAAEAHAANPQWTSPFYDIGQTAWYYDSVEFAHENGLMVGRGGNIFDPEGTMTRAMAMTTLWRYAGEPAGSTNIFSDVPENTWYTQAVSWASQNGIVEGVGNGRFAPNDQITREQLSAMLYRFADSRGLTAGDGSQIYQLNSYSDKETVSDWAAEPMGWVTNYGIINGIADQTGSRFLDPTGNATRAQMATVLMRFAQSIDNYTASQIGKSQALQIALNHAGLQAADTLFTNVRAEFDNGRPVYDVEFYAGNIEYDYEIDAVTGQILDFDYDMESTFNPASPVAPTGNISEAQALQIALAHAGLQASNTVYTSVKADFDDGRKVYDVEFYAGNTEYDYEIDATTGQILDFDYDMEGTFVPVSPVTPTNPSAPVSPVTPTTPPAPVSPVVPSTNIGEAQALQIALAHAGVQASDTLFTSVRADFDDGRAVYDVEFYAGNTEYDYEIDAATGQILDFDFDMESHFTPPVNPGSNNGNTSSGYISVDAAKQTALSRVPGATDSNIRISADYDDGRMIYEGKIIYNGMEYEFEIDAATGNIIEWDVESVYD